jgi:hydroxymethylbilane synthase
VTTQSPGPLRLGTRRSALARTQSEQVAAALRAATGREVELVEVTTTGDVSTASLSSIGGTGVFVSALRDALLAGRVDLAVHSLKDLPTAPADGLVLAAVPAREDPRDVLVARDGLTLGELGEGARVGTGSPRRAAQLRALGLGLDVVDIRGNVDTRLGLVSKGTCDAVVLARAGLVRLGRADEITEVLDPLQVLPAPGQGALAVECREDDEATRAACGVLDHPATRVAVTAERALLAALEAGCTAPVGALAEVAEGEDGDELFLRAVVAAPDGGATLRRSSTGSPAGAGELGRALAAELLADGAADLVAAADTPQSSLKIPHHDTTAAMTMVNAAGRVEK